MLLHHPHQSFWVAYPLIDASMADAKMAVKVERIASLHRVTYRLSSPNKLIHFVYECNATPT